MLNLTVFCSVHDTKQHALLRFKFYNSLEY